ncbi:hypothetical protein ASF49_15120 [Methylobacterium sp. Leaf104]|uniref:hypothetical protein n=1 Tax=Methylobacterium TaxID=407 RepID=UPI0006F34604|nr:MULTISPECIES: hypothetical protein [Methylobacterium]KQP29995.1 hypothetical protein ASF49_15120 [Methylobacterium sp. Leaf104]MCI9882301.1 hypothetical protein [Methylobacterium goesingense]
MADDFHDGNDARRYRARLRRQRRYQAGYRQRLKEKAIPQKDDFATACLDELLVILARDPNAVPGFVGRVLRRVTRKFGREAAADRLTIMVQRTAQRLRAAEVGSQ